MCSPGTVLVLSSGFSGDPYATEQRWKSKAKALSDRSSPDNFFQLIGEKESLCLASNPKLNCSLVFGLFG